MLLSTWQGPLSISSREEEFLCSVPCVGGGMPLWMASCLVWVLEKILLSSVLGRQQCFPGSVSGAGRGDLNCVAVGIFSPSSILRVAWQLIMLML